MEKIYLTPEIEIVDLELNGTLLSGSDEIYDPDTPPTTPTIPGGAGDDDLV